MIDKYIHKNRRDAGRYRMVRCGGTPMTERSVILSADEVRATLAGRMTLMVSPEEEKYMHERYQRLARYLIAEMSAKDKIITNYEFKILNLEKALQTGTENCSVCNEIIIIREGFGYDNGKFYCHFSKGPCRFLKIDAVKK